jgi:two-component system sensor histidine kinase KdpD
MTRHAMRQERRPALEQVGETAGLWRDFLITGIAWLIVSLIVVRFTLVSVTTAGALLGMVFLLGAAGEFLFASAKVSLPMGRRLPGYVLAGATARRAGQAGRVAAQCELLTAAAVSLAGGHPALAAVLDRARQASGMESVTLLERGTSHGERAAPWKPVAVSGRPPPGRGGHAAVMVPATGTLCLALAGPPLPAAEHRSLGLFAALAAAALTQQRLAAAAQAAQPTAEADRMRTALLAAVSHDLRTPLAAAKAAVSGLRSPGIQLTAAERDDLLDTAEQSLDLLARLAASLLDVSRLQAGALPVFPRPADLGQIITRSLDDLGSLAHAVVVDIPPGLPPVMADPAIMERVIANVTANALRYSADRSPPLLTASARGDRIELRVADHGPGVPAADRNRMFAPFQRLGDTSHSTGVGLGLAVARSLTDAMRGTLEPAETPGGGLTMTISLPAAPRPAQSYPTEPGHHERETMTDPTPSRDHHCVRAWYGTSGDRHLRRHGLQQHPHVGAGVHDGPPRPVARGSRLPRPNDEPPPQPRQSLHLWLSAQD